MTPMTREQALGKLGSVPFGRIIFTHRALPAVRPVNHIIDHDGQVIIRSHEGAAIVDVTGSDHGTVVAYEADQIDSATGTGWTVTITGLARLVGNARDVARYRRVLHPWAGDEMNYVIRIDPQLVTGYELTAGKPAEIP